MCVLFTHLAVPSTYQTGRLTVGIVFPRATTVPGKVLVFFSQYKCTAQTRQFRQFSLWQISLFQIHRSIHIYFIMGRDTDATFGITIFHNRFPRYGAIRFLSFRFGSNHLYLRSIQSLILPIFGQPVTETFIIIRRSTESLKITIFP